MLFDCWEMCVCIRFKRISLKMLQSVTFICVGVYSNVKQPRMKTKKKKTNNLNWFLAVHIYSYTFCCCCCWLNVTTDLLNEISFAANFKYSRRIEHTQTNNNNGNPSFVSVVHSRLIRWNVMNGRIIWCKRPTAIFYYNSFKKNRRFAICRPSDLYLLSFRSVCIKYSANTNCW